ncbi:hypothetical protein [Pseudobacteriovorax antillogorgiicola]|uniref:Uncharacterized protein n=1 Tax=Pseudobacteriovorax antillogorgiicola TaxID=1513793 RepID=A0A1Y6CFQ8_9BACT|nr:hypothetical protein [Pseudobacteriovorax antillogorgiicola]TCS48999.1 hypothetical protein EDD56_11641 [Pseudobacteriovorax antillogorgiicola]SMF53285.1 hypothetical protein SAMN06296036_116113 [Pseudobacteriovorax antillogorgiicola]
MSLVDDLAVEIRHYLDGHRNRNLRTLERKSGVSYATIRRIVQNEVGNPSIEKTVIPILSQIMPTKDVAKFLSLHDIPLADFIKTFSEYKDKSIVLTDLDQRIILAARAKEGTTRERIVWEHGNTSGLKRLEHLLNEGVLKEVNGRILCEDHYIPSIDGVLIEIEKSARNFNKDKIGHGAYYGHFSGSMSWPDYERLRAVAKEYWDTVQDISENPTPGPEVIANVNILADFQDVEDIS